MFNEEKEGLDWCTEFSKEELDKIRNTKKGRLTVGKLIEFYDVSTRIVIERKNGIVMYSGSINFMPDAFYELKVVSFVDGIRLKIIVK